MSRHHHETTSTPGREKENDKPTSPALEHAPSEPEPIKVEPSPNEAHGAPPIAPTFSPAPDQPPAAVARNALTRAREIPAHLLETDDEIASRHARERAEHAEHQKRRGR